MREIYSRRGVGLASPPPRDMYGLLMTLTVNIRYNLEGIDAIKRKDTEMTTALAACLSK